MNESRSMIRVWVEGHVGKWWKRMENGIEGDVAKKRGIDRRIIRNSLGFGMRWILECGLWMQREARSGESGKVVTLPLCWVWRQLSFVSGLWFRIESQRYHERVIVVNYDQVTRFHGLDIPSVMMGDKDHAMRVSSLANEEPLGVVELCVDVMWEVIWQYCCDGSNSVVGEGKTPLCHGGDGGIG